MVIREEGRDWASGKKRGRYRPKEPGRRKDTPRL